MMALKSRSKTRYRQSAVGAWGTFCTPAGSVQFLSCKAKISAASTDAETRLTQFLRPVREALSTREMDFNQLLQRDLDDHRVATELVPYLMDPNKTGPAFFPPIVVALLPFDGPVPLEQFPEKTSIATHEDDISRWRGYAFGAAFKFERLVNDDDSDHEMKIGRVSWNEELAQLVVIDGQHRAMALLAIYRTLNDSWEGSGDKYRHFYEPAVRAQLSRFSQRRNETALSGIELPVTLVWFPELTEPADNHQLAARKLFVDVNKNARQPSDSRVLLLSDDKLSAILTRRVLNEFRMEHSSFPIYCIEYDHPERDQASSSKWSAISNVSILHGCIYRAVFGPLKFVQRVDINFGGRESPTEAASFMLDTLEIKSGIPSVIEESDRSLRRDEITDEEFPRSHLDFFEEQLMKTWGGLVVRLLSEFKPFRAHGEALTELRDGWDGSDSVSRLAKDAMFEGVGMYWTLRDSYRHWLETNKIRAVKLHPTDIVNAWQETERKAVVFDEIRAKHYLGSSSADAIKASNTCYAVFETNACQLGLVLAIRTLAHAAKIDVASFDVFSSKIVQALNEALDGNAAGKYGRRVFLCKEEPFPINRIAKLDSPYAVYFRYFWLECLNTSEARAVLDGVVSKDVFDGLLPRARKHYLERLVKIFSDALRRSHPDWKDSKVMTRAKESAEKELVKAAAKWYGISEVDFRRSYESLGENGAQGGEFHESATEETNEEPDVEEENGADSIESILGRDPEIKL